MKLQIKIGEVEFVLSEELKLNESNYSHLAKCDKTATLFLSGIERIISACVEANNLIDKKTER